MTEIDLVVAISTNQHQVPHIRLSEEVLDHIERCRIKPLQVVEEESKRMLRACEYANEPPEDQLEAALPVLLGKNWDRRLFSSDGLQFRDEVHNQERNWTQFL